MNDQTRVRAVKWAYVAFKASVKDLKEKYAKFQLFLRTQDKEKTGYIA